MRCPYDHVVVEGELDSLCPQCLLDLPMPTLDRIGPYAILNKLGEGGFGCVYLARRSGEELSELVALKVIRNGELADKSAILGFGKEIALLKQLSADCIVKIRDAGEHEGLPYYVMEYMRRGTLRERMADFRGDSTRAATLMIQIATAVDFLHRASHSPERRPILHRDLKPENILFDEADRPRLSDFGIAKLSSGEVWTQDSQLRGCARYMAPEQVYPGADRCLTAAADVYSLGAILYELFTGRPPFVGTDADVLLKLKLEDPVAPRELCPKLDRYLETVVLNALEKEPARRYRSAAAFAQDLERALSGKPPEEAPPTPFGARSWRFLRRRPLLAGLCCWLVSLTLVIAFSVRAAVRAEQDAELRQEQENAAMASVQAVAFRFQLQEYLHRVARLAEAPEIVAILRSPEIESPSQTLIDRTRGFDSAFVMGTDGRQRARTTQMPEEYMARSFAFRDYFINARQLAERDCAPGAHRGERRAYLARSHISESDARFEVAISAPICDERGWVGMLGATFPSSRALGVVRAAADHPRRFAALLGPRDVDRKDVGQPLPDGFTFLVHPGLDSGKEYRLQGLEPARIRSALAISGDSEAEMRYVPPYVVRDYVDPIPGYAGQWSAAIAPVNAAGFIVVVQSPRESGLRARLSESALNLATPFGIGFALLLLIGVARRRDASPNAVPASLRWRW